MELPNWKPGEVNAFLSEGPAVFFLGILAVSIAIVLCSRPGCAFTSFPFFCFGAAIFVYRAFLWRRRRTKVDEAYHRARKGWWNFLDTLRDDPRFRTALADGEPESFAKVEEAFDELRLGISRLLQKDIEPPVTEQKG